MASVYKVELEIVSDFVNYREESILDIVEQLVESYTNEKNGLGFRVHNLKVVRKA